jgi:ABC-type uncharacterized transport system involved in gliding motility auxiliary subunit
MRDAIEKVNYVVKTVSLFEEESVPEDCYILIIAGPSEDYFDAEIGKIERYLEQGKNAFFLIDPRTELPNIEALIAKYGIELHDDVVIDPYSRVFGGEYTIPVVTEYVKHPITADMTNVATFYPLARSIGMAEDVAGDVVVQMLAKTGKSAWGETDLEGVSRGEAVISDEDYRPPVSLAAIASKEYENDIGEVAQSKIVVVGDSDFAENAAFRISGNSDFFLNVVNYLAEEKDLIAIRPKEGLGDQIFMTASQGRLLFLLSVVLLPLSVIVFGISVFVKKRRAG